MDKDKYRGKGHYSPNNYTLKTNLRTVFNSITFSVKDLLHYIEIFTLDKKKKLFRVKFDAPNTTEHIDVITKYHYNLGRCYSIRPKNHVIMLGVTSVDIVGRMGIYVYFGYPGQFMYNTKTKVQNYF